MPAGGQGRAGAAEGAVAQAASTIDENARCNERPHSQQHAAMACCPNRSHPDLGRAGLIGKRQKERRAKNARRTSRFIAQWPPLLRDFTKEIARLIKTKPPAAGFTSSRGCVADAFFGASPVVASALGIHSGATPCGPLQPNTPFSTGPPKGDISIWQKRGHFYLALTSGLSGRVHDTQVVNWSKVRAK